MAEWLVKVVNLLSAPLYHIISGSLTIYLCRWGFITFIIIILKIYLKELYTRNLFASQALNFGGRAAEEGEKKLCESDNNMQIDVDFFFFIRIKLSYPSSKGELSASSDRQADRQTDCLPAATDGW